MNPEVGSKFPVDKSIVFVTISKETKKKLMIISIQLDTSYTSVIRIDTCIPGMVMAWGKQNKPMENRCFEYFGILSFFPKLTFAINRKRL